MFCIDRIIGEIVILENMDTEEIINTDINYFDKGIEEGNLFEKVDEKYFFNEVATLERKANIKDLLNRLKK